MPILKPPKGIQLNRSHRLARGLVGCWLFNENTGGKVFDLSRNGNDGTLQGNTSWKPGKYGSCLDFDGDGDYVSVPYNSGYDALDYVTISLWVKLNSDNSNDMMFFSSSSGTSWKWLYVWKNGSTKEIKFVNSNGWTSATSTTVTTSNIWYHVVGVWNNKDMYIYINGVLEDSTTDVDSLTSPSYGLKFGRWEATNPKYLNGQIGHVMIFNRTLSTEEIQQLYREPSCMFEHGLSPAVLYAPAEGVVELSSSIDASTATTATVKIDKKVSASCACATEVSASLKLSRNLATELQSLANLIGSLTLAGEVGLAGTISAALSLNGKLSLVTAGKWFTGSLKTERKWLIDALFAGMTANAFKLGTVLSNGWFWMRRLECSVLYRGLSMDTVDFANILTVAEHNDNTISPPDYISHDAGLSYFYVVRRFNGCGYQECTLAAAFKIAINIDGELIEPQPNKVFTCVVSQINGNKVQLLWFYCPIEQKSQPTRFNIYCDNKTGQIDYQEPLTTISYQGKRFYSFSSNMFETGKYLFAVRPMDAEQVENDSLARIGIQIDAASPEAIDILNAETS